MADINLARHLPEPLSIPHACYTCNTCSSRCPVSGVDGLDPRQAIRMIAYGMDQELIESRFPWICTLCGRCESACPMNVPILKILRTVRGLRARDRVPGPLHKGVVMDLEKGNNLGIPQEDFLFLLNDLGYELEDEGFPGFYVPIDKEGANFLLTINSKEPFAEPDDLKFWWKIFYAAKESWTVPSVNWEGVNWALFSGDDASMRELVGRIVANMQRLKIPNLILPE